VTAKGKNMPNTFLYSRALPMAYSPRKLSAFKLNFHTTAPSSRLNSWWHYRCLLCLFKIVRS